MIQYQYNFKNISTTGHGYLSDVVSLPLCSIVSLKVALNYIDVVHKSDFYLRSPCMYLLYFGDFEGLGWA